MSPSRIFRRATVLYCPRCKMMRSYISFQLCPRCGETTVPGALLSSSTAEAVAKDPLTECVREWRDWRGSDNG